MKQKTEGRITINIAGSETLGNDSGMLTSLRTGALDLTANSQGATSSLVPEFAVLGLPFLFADADHAFKVVDGSVEVVSEGQWKLLRPKEARLG